MVKTKNFSLVILILSSLLIIFFGRNFLDISFSFFPGKVLDFFITIMFLIKIYEKKIDGKKLLLFLLFLLFYTFLGGNLELGNINQIGQDLLIIIYPTSIYLIFKNVNLKISNNYLHIFISISLLTLILDYLLERIYLLDSILGINFSKTINLSNYVNISDLKETEVVFISLLFYELTTNNSKIGFLKFKYFNLFLIGLLGGFYSTQNRSILFGLFLYYLLKIFLTNFKENKNIYLFLIFGLLFSFIFTFGQNSNKNLQYIEYINNSNLVSNTGINRVRVHSFECFKVIIKTNSDCEFNRSQLIVEDEINKLINLRNINNSLNDIGILVFFDKVKSYDDCFTLLEVCSKIIENPYRDALNLNFKRVCGDTLDWRINLWKGSLKFIFENSSRAIFGSGVGYPIPEKLSDGSYINYICYKEVIDSNKPLRSAHNTFLTILFRFGILFYLFIAYVTGIIFKDRKSSIYEEIPLVVSVGFMTLIDPLLDSPVALFLLSAYYLLKYKLNFINNTQ